MGRRWPGDILRCTSQVAGDVTPMQFMSASANVLVSASFPTAVSSDWQIRVVLIGCSTAAAVDHLLKVRAVRCMHKCFQSRDVPPESSPKPNTRPYPKAGGWQDNLGAAEFERRQWEVMGVACVA